MNMDVIFLSCLCLVLLRKHCMSPLWFVYATDSVGFLRLAQTLMVGYSSDLLVFRCDEDRRECSQSAFC